MTLTTIADRLQQDLARQIGKSGMMFRLFWRVKTIESIRHKMGFKGHLYISGKSRMQDIIGLRVVVYFPDDVDVLSTFFGLIADVLILILVELLYRLPSSIVEIVRFIP